MSEEDRIEEVESETPITRSNRSRSTRGEKVRRIFCRHMKLFLSKGGSRDYDNERIGDIEFPLRYRNLVKRWLPKELPQMDMNCFLNGRIYHIAPSSLHGLELFSMDHIMVKYGTETELMEYVGPRYKYNDWLLLVQYKHSLQRYVVATNYLQLLDNNRNKGATMYIDGRPKASVNIVRFINST